MAIISIAIVSCSNDIAALKVLRSYSSISVAVLRQMIGTHAPALVLSTFEYPLEMGREEGEKQQQCRIIEACNRLEEAGALLKLGYAPTHDDRYEIIDRTIMMNLFDSEIGYHNQDHD